MLWLESAIYKSITCDVFSLGRECSNQIYFALGPCHSSQMCCDVIELVRMESSLLASGQISPASLAAVIQSLGDIISCEFPFKSSY